jgi:hypothetical protein
MSDTPKPAEYGLCLRIIYNIPIFGGFCAPTVSPDPSFFRHFSNEFTLIASGRFMDCLPCIESNAFCRFGGGAGSSFGRRHRKKCMSFAFFMSMVGMICLIVSTLAMSRNATLIKAAAFSQGEMISNGKTHLRMWVGLNGRVTQADCSDSPYAADCKDNLGLAPNWYKIEGTDATFESVTDWTSETGCALSFSLTVLTGSNGTFSFEDMCQDCGAAALSMVSSAFISIATQIPQITTDLQRSTSFGDVNCQANMGMITSMFGTISGLKGIQGFLQDCSSNFPKDVPGTPITFHWRPGPGIICLLIATLLKVGDILVHAFVPTPKARGRAKPADVKVLEEYMANGYDEDQVPGNTHKVNNFAP